MQPFPRLGKALPPGGQFRQLLLHLFPGISPAHHPVHRKALLGLYGDGPEEHVGEMSPPVAGEHLPNVVVGQVPQRVVQLVGEPVPQAVVGKIPVQPVIPRGVGVFENEEIPAGVPVLRRVLEQGQHGGGTLVQGRVRAQFPHLGHVGGWGGAAVQLGGFLLLAENQAVHHQGALLHPQGKGKASVLMVPPADRHKGKPQLLPGRERAFRGEMLPLSGQHTGLGTLVPHRQNRAGNREGIVQQKVQLIPLLKLHGGPAGEAAAPHLVGAFAVGDQGVGGQGVVPGEPAVVHRPAVQAVFRQGPPHRRRLPGAPAVFHHGELEGRHVVEHQVLNVAAVVDALGPDEIGVLLQLSVGDVAVNPVLCLNLVSG